MKTVTLIGNAVLWCLLVPVFADSEKCIDLDDTQYVINHCFQDSLENREHELSRTLSSIRLMYKDETAFLKKLNDAQVKWRESLNADVELKFPAKNKRFYGSVYPTCYAQYKSELIAARIVYLQHWLYGYEEGEVCSGSVAPMKFLSGDSDG